MTVITAVRAAAPVESQSFEAEAALARLLDGQDLDTPSAEALFSALVQGQLEPAQIAALLVALRLKGETANELIGAAHALSAATRPFPRPDYLFADSCGTGGDGSDSINISTAAAITAAACGLPVAKHGNRAFSSRCGSADVLEALGAKLDPTPETSRRALDETGFCFLLAPYYHPGLAHAGPVRRMLGIRTVMNLLGPCLNPARPPVQLLGVANSRLLDPIARTLVALGVGNALVVYGAGLDEVALHDATEAMRVKGSLVEPVRLTPEDAGLERQPVGGLEGGDTASNAARIKALLEGGGSDAERSAVAINTAALLVTAGLETSLRGAAARAIDAMASGDAGRTLGRFIEISHG